MKALTIRQPWAWLIINGGKNIENRTWNTHGAALSSKGRALFHAIALVIDQRIATAKGAPWFASLVHVSH